MYVCIYMQFVVKLTSSNKLASYIATWSIVKLKVLSFSVYAVRFQFPLNATMAIVKQL